MVPVLSEHACQEGRVLHEKDFRAPAKLVVAVAVQGKSFEDANLNCIDCNKNHNETSFCQVHSQQLKSLEDHSDEVEEIRRWLF